MGANLIYRRSMIAAFLILIAFSAACGSADRGDGSESVQMYTLRVVTAPWDGGDFRLDPLPSNENGSTIQGDYGHLEVVNIRALPAPGWEVTQVDQAERVGDSDDFKVVMERNRTLALSFRKLSPGTARVEAAPEATEEGPTTGKTPVTTAEDNGNPGNAKVGTHAEPSDPTPTIVVTPTFTVEPKPTPTPTIVVTPTFSAEPTPTSTPNTPIAPKTGMTIYPSESTHGTIVHFSASAFSSDSPIVVTYGSEYIRVATVISDGSGNASGTFRIPLNADAPSSNLVKMTDDSGNTVVSLHEIPTPSISTSSPVAPAGSTIMVTGRHFPIDRVLSDITIGDIVAIPKSTTPQTDNLGGFEMELWIPHQPEGLKSLKVTVQGDDQIISAETTLEVARRLPLTIMLDSYEGIRNSIVKWDVSRTLANSSLTITFGSQRNIVAGIRRILGSGRCFDSV